MLPLLLLSACEEPGLRQHRFIRDPSITYRDALFLIEQTAARDLLGTDLAQEAWNRDVDRLVRGFRPPADTSAAILCDALIAYVYDTLGIQPVFTAARPETFLASEVMRRKQGSCTGISAIFLLIAEAHQLPLLGVFLPGHFFLRWEQPGFTRNIETLRFGLDRSNDYYQARFRLDLHPCYRLVSHPPRQCLAAQIFNLGNGYLAQQQWRPALSEFEAIPSLAGEMAEARGSQGIAWWGLGNAELAKENLRAATRLDPGSPLAWENLLRICVSDGDAKCADECQKETLRLAGILAGSVEE